MDVLGFQRTEHFENSDVIFDYLTKVLEDNRSITHPIEVSEFTPEKLPGPKRKGAISNHELPKINGWGWNLKITCLKRKNMFQTSIFWVPLLVFGGVNTIFLWHGVNRVQTPSFWGLQNAIKISRGILTWTATYSGPGVFFLVPLRFSWDCYCGKPFNANANPKQIQTVIVKRNPVASGSWDIYDP